MRQEIGQAHEVGTAMPLRSRMSQVIGQVTEVGTAMPITPRGGRVSIPVSAGAVTVAGGTVTPRVVARAESADTRSRSHEKLHEEARRLQWRLFWLGILASYYMSNPDALEALVRWMLGMEP